MVVSFELYLPNQYGAEEEDRYRIEKLIGFYSYFFGFVRWNKLTNNNRTNHSLLTTELIFLELGDSNRKGSGDQFLEERSLFLSESEFLNDIYKPHA